MPEGGSPPWVPSPVGRSGYLFGLDGCSWFAFVLHSAESLVAVAADGPGVLERVLPALLPRDDVIRFRAVRSAAIHPVEAYATKGAACEAGVSVVVESLVSDSHP